jgi:hypothetical protein
MLNGNMFRDGQAVESVMRSKLICFWTSPAQKELFLESTSRELPSLGQLDPLIGPKWPSAEHGRFSTEADIDRPANKEWQPPVKHPHRKCWSAYIANGGIP